MTKTSRRERKRKKGKKSRPVAMGRADSRTKPWKTGRLLLYAGVIVVLFVAVFGFHDRLFHKRPGELHPSLGNRHVPLGSAENFPYNTNPPTSGDHYDPRPRWGIHKEPLLKGLHVHGLEDGGVIINYRCKDCPDLVRKIEAIVLRYPEFVIAAPYYRMKPLIALTAWQRIDRLSDYDEGRIVSFVEAFKGIDHHAR